VWELLDTAAAKIGAKVETVPSIIPTRPGCTTRSTNAGSSSKPARRAIAWPRRLRDFFLSAVPTLTQVL
jgi:hypothetical protein